MAVAPSTAIPSKATTLPSGAWSDSAQPEPLAESDMEWLETAPPPSRVAAPSTDPTDAPKGTPLVAASSSDPVAAGGSQIPWEYPIINEYDPLALPPPPPPDGLHVPPSPHGCPGLLQAFGGKSTHAPQLRVVVDPSAVSVHVAARQVPAAPASHDCPIWATGHSSWAAAVCGPNKRAAANHPTKFRGFMPIPPLVRRESLVRREYVAYAARSSTRR